MQTQLNSLRGAWGTLPKRAQVAILAVTVVTVVVLFLVLRAATSTEWVVASQDLSADKLGQAEASLEEAGIEYRANPTGTALEVPKDMHGKAAAALMTAGIAAKGTNVTCAKQFGEGGSMAMADTTAKHAVKLETCMEGQVANTLENMQGVTKANVDVTLSAKELFTEDRSAAKASVVLDTEGVSLTPKAVKGMQQLIANSFPDMTVGNVAISDETGTIISGADSEEGANAEKLTMEAKKNREIERELMAQIEKVVGPNNAVVSSNVELDMDRIKRGVVDNKPANENGEPLAETEIYEREILRGEAAAGTEGVAGTGTNVGVGTDNRTVTPGIDGATDPDQSYANEKGNVAYANNKIEEIIDVAKGSVVRFRLGVVVDEKVDAGSARAVNNLVQAWMGGNAQDSFSFDRAALATAQPIKTSTDSRAGEIAGYLKWLLLGMGLIGIAFVLRRSLTQRTAELLAPADDLLMLEPGDFTPIPIAELEAALAAGQPDADRKARLDMQKKVEQIADTKPHDVANELRRWMHSGESSFASNRNAG
ncbi:MAG: flagellar M-ring protein FliF [Thermoleophilia bacterium]|nr:flagellar M-ring protein FliF [Thermoleophilia bacterium]MCZ4495440.1 flagellar M-ring protein FliF [Thermoleophilia bacterium]